MRLHATPPAAPSFSARRGIVIVGVLVVIVVLSLAAYQYSDLMTSEYKASASFTRAAQARAFAESGVHYAAALLSDPTNAGANTCNNPEAFQGQAVGEGTDPARQGRFSIVCPAGPDEQLAGGASFRFGVIDEGGKINLNTLIKLDKSGKILRDMLMKLPDMTEDIANAIVDWVDADDQPGAGGAENEYYSALSPPYRAKNGPIDSIEELLLVKGIAEQPALLLGTDRNRNGILDGDEGDAGPGWAAYLTVYSRELNVDSEGQPRIYLNGDDLAQLYTDLSNAVDADTAAYLVLARVYKPASMTKLPKNAKTSSGGGAQKSTKQKASQKIASIYDLIDTYVTIPAEDPKGEPTYVVSPLTADGQLRELLPVLLDRTTTSKGQDIYGRININTAPAAVVAALPELTALDVEVILATRPSLDSTDPLDDAYKTPAWLVLDANIKPETMKKLEKYITTRSQVYRLQSVGYFDGPGPIARVEAVIDTNNGRPRIMYYRDLTELGRGFDLQQP